MIYLDTFLYYTLFTSIVLIYGIGINQVSAIGIAKINTFTFFLKAIINILSTSILTWLVTAYILVPLKLVEIFPVIAYLIFVSLSSLLEAVNRITTEKSTAEFIVSFLIIILSIIESTSILNTIVICLSCFISLLIICPFIYTLKNRATANGQKINEMYYSILFVFLAVLILIISVFDISWLNPGVIK